MKNIDNEFIEAFAAQYWGQEACSLTGYVTLYSIFDAKYLEVDEGVKIEHIELRSIESLTEEELSKVVAIEWLIHRPELKRWDDDFAFYGETMDYLRSIGVACSFRGIKVQEMIESGKLKLRQ